MAPSFITIKPFDSLSSGDELQVPADAVRVVEPVEGEKSANIYVAGVGKLQTRIDAYSDSFWGMIKGLGKRGCTLTDMSCLFVNTAFIQALFAPSDDVFRRDPKTRCLLYVDGVPPLPVSRTDTGTWGGLSKALDARPAFVDSNLPRGTANSLFFLDQVACVQKVPVEEGAKDDVIDVKVTFRDGKSVLATMHEKRFPPAQKPTDSVSRNAGYWFGAIGPSVGG